MFLNTIFWLDVGAFFPCFLFLFYFQIMNLFIEGKGGFHINWLQKLYSSRKTNFGKLAVIFSVSVVIAAIPLYNFVVTVIAMWRYWVVSAFENSK